MVAIACYVLAFNSHRPNYDIIEQYKPATPILVAKNSYKDELKLNKAILTQEQINNIVEDVKKKEIEEQYQKNLYLLAQVIYSEAGSDWISDEVQLMCANVVMNRVESPYFSHTIYDVVHAPNQYQFIQDKAIIVPNQRAIDNAKKILNGLRVLPKNVVYQSEYKNLGDGNYKKVKTKYSTIYFNYKNNIK